MKFFIDTADIEEIRMANRRGWVDGVTTNPSLVAKTGRDHVEVLKDICAEVNGPVNAEVMSLEAEKMVAEGKEFAKLHDNIIVKIPMTEDGLIAVRQLAAEGIRTNVTLVFNPIQALMVAKAGASYVSPFVGRLDDISSPGLEMVGQIQQIYSNYGLKTETLVASIRHPIHILDSALIGADIVTIPFKVMQNLAKHPLTDRGIEAFVRDYEASQKTQ